MKFGGKRIPLTARPNIDSHKLVTMRRAIIKNKYLSEIEVDEMKLKVQSKCENQLQNVEDNNSAHSDQHPTIQPHGDIESQHIPPLQTHVNPEQISNNVKNCLNSEEINVDPQSQPELDEINELTERVLVEWIKFQNIEMSERNSLPKIRNTSKNQSTISKINPVSKITTLSLIYVSTVIRTELWCKN